MMTILRQPLLGPKPLRRSFLTPVAICLLLAGCVTNNVENGWTFRKFDPAAEVPPKAAAPAPPAETAQTSEPQVKAPPPTAVVKPDLIETPTPAPQPATATPLRNIRVEDAPQGEVRVAILLPLSGPNAKLGRAMLNAAQLSLFELADENFVLMTYDTHGGGDGAARAAENAARDGARLILGPLLANSVAAAHARARTFSTELNIVAFSNSPEVAGDGVFILGFTPRQQVRAILDYAASQGVSRVVALAPDNDYGRAVVDAARSHSGGLFQTMYYDPAAHDFTGQIKALARYEQRRGALREHRQTLTDAGDAASLRTLRQLEKRDTLGDPPFDAVLMPDTGRNLRTLSAMLSYYDVDAPTVRFLGLRSWDLTRNLATEPALQNAWFSATPMEGRIGFAKRYKAAFGGRPPRHASLAYDAAALAIVLARTARHANGMFSRAALMAKSGFLGVDGVFRFQPDGVAERPFTIFEITKTGIVARRPAPQTFQHLTN
jgi:branched-chain amino acid transport system substrate-binding protein